MCATMHASSPVPVTSITPLCQLELGISKKYWVQVMGTMYKGTRMKQQLMIIKDLLFINELTKLSRPNRPIQSLT